LGRGLECRKILTAEAARPPGVDLGSGCLTVSSVEGEGLAEGFSESSIVADIVEAIAKERRGVHHLEAVTEGSGNAGDFPAVFVPAEPPLVVLGADRALLPTSGDAARGVGHLPGHSECLGIAGDPAIRQTQVTIPVAVVIPAQAADRSGIATGQGDRHVAAPVKGHLEAKVSLDNPIPATPVDADPVIVQITRQ